MPATHPSTASAGRRAARSLVSSQEFGILLVLVGMLVVVGILNPDFLSFASFTNIGQRAAWYGILAAKGTPLRVHFVSVDATPELVAGFRTQHPGLPATSRVADPAAVAPYIQALGLDAGAGLPVHAFTGSDGKVRWHVNPSTRPIVAKETGVQDAGEPSPPETRTGGVTGNADDPTSDGAVPAVPPDADSDDPLNYNDHPITVPMTGDNASMSVRVSWTALTGDWDVKLYEDTNGDGKSQAAEPVVSTSQTGPSNIEEVSANGAPRLPSGKKYVLRVNNFAATPADGYDVDITF